MSEMDRKAESIAKSVLEIIKLKFSGKHKKGEILNPGSKGGKGFYDDHGKWHYGAKPEHDKLGWSVGKDGKVKIKTYKEAKLDSPDLTQDQYKSMYKKAYTDYYKAKKNGELDDLSDKPDKITDMKADINKPKKALGDKLEWHADGGKFNALKYNDMLKDHPDLTQEQYKSMYKKAYTEFYKAKQAGTLDKYKQKKEEPKKEEPKKEEPKKEPEKKAMTVEEQTKFLKDYAKQIWNTDANGKFYIHPYSMTKYNLQKEGIDIDEETYKKGIYKTAYSDFYKKKSANPNYIGSEGKKKEEEKPKEEPKEEPKKDQSKQQHVEFTDLNTMQNEMGEVLYPDDLSSKTKADILNATYKDNINFKDLDNTNPIDNVGKLVAYKSDYDDWLTGKIVSYNEKVDTYEISFSKYGVLTDDIKSKDIVVPYKGTKLETVKPKKENTNKPKESDKDEPQYLEKQTAMNKLSQFIDMKATSGSIEIYGPKNELLNDGVDSKYKLKELDEKDAIGKYVYWQKDQNGKSWVVGQIKNYDAVKGEYEIAGGWNGSFTKNRPANAILEIYENEKTLNPKWKPKLVKADTTVPMFTHEDAKKYIVDKFKNMTDSQKETGVTVFKDSAALENMGMRVMYDKVNGDHVVEFKLRDIHMQNDLQKKVAKGGNKEVVTWKGKDGYTYQAKTYKYVNKIDKDTKIEYFAKGFDSSYDTGYALRDTVRIKVKTNDPGEAFEKANKYLNDNGFNVLTKDTDDVAYKKMKAMQLLNQVNPKKADAFTGNVDTIDLGKIEKEVESKLGKNWDSNVSYKEVGPGHKAHVVEGRHLEYEKHGYNYVWMGLGSDMGAVNAALSIMKNGAMSTSERHKQGIVGAGASSHSDYSTGGAEYVFTRMAVKSKDNSSFGGYKSDGIRVTFKKEVIDRTDWFGYNNDSYGETNVESKKYGNYSNRNSAEDHIKAVNSNFSSSNEVMFKKSIGANYIENILVPNEIGANNLYNEFKKTHGEILDDGRHAADIIAITTGKMGNPVKMTFRQYAESNGIKL